MEEEVADTDTSADVTADVCWMCNRELEDKLARVPLAKFIADLGFTEVEWKAMTFVEAREEFKKRVFAVQGVLHKLNYHEQKRVADQEEVPSYGNNIPTYGNNIPTIAASMARGLKGKP